MKFISSIFKAFLLSALIVAQINFAYAQTASILPPAKTTFVDQNGKPLVSGTVEFFIPNTTTHKTTWQDAAETVPNLNPVVLDAAGRALILGSGSYRQIVKDRDKNLIWDQITSSVGSGGGGSGGTGTGDGDLVGTIKPWAGLIAPNQYLFTYGQEISRTTYAALFTAITSSQLIFCTSGSAILTGFGDTTAFPIGAAVEVSCVPSGSSTILSKTASTITLAASANLSIQTTAVVFPWGNGDASTTFNLPDFKGYTLAGNNNMGGAASSRLSSTYFGSNPNAIGAAGGNQSGFLQTTNLPPYNPSGAINITDPGHTHSGVIVGETTYNSPGGATTVVQAVVGGSTASATTGISASFNGSAQGGNSTPFSLIQPTKTTNYIIKVTPDQNSAVASGVTSLGLMTGDIACGTGLLCTGNIISGSGATTLSVGVSGILGGSSGNILFNNAGVLGEYGVATNNDYNSATPNKIVQASNAFQAETVTTYGTTTTFDFHTFKSTQVTLTGNITTQTLVNIVAGKAGTITFIQDATGGRTTVWNSIFKFSGGTLPTLTATANAVDMLTYSCRTTTFCAASLLTDVR